MHLRADFKGSIDAESGMILNLKDVDLAMKKVMKSDLVFRSHRDFLISFWKSLRNQFPRYLKSLCLTYKGQSWIYDGKSWSYVYKTSSRFADPQIETARQVIFESTAPLKASWIKGFRSRVWKSPESCVHSLKLLKAPLKHVQIERPEWRGWEKWYFD